MTAHTRLSALLAASCLAATCGGGTPVPTSPSGATVVPHRDVDGNADDRPRGRTEHIRGRDVDICAGGRHEPADV